MSAQAIRSGFSSLQESRRAAYAGGEESSVCADHTQTVLCSPRTALLTAGCSPGTKGEHAAGQHQYRVKLTRPSLQEGALPPPASEWERSHTELTDSGGSPVHVSQK